MPESPSTGPAFIPLSEVGISEELDEHSASLKTRFKMWLATSEVFPQVLGHLPDSITRPMIEYATSQIEKADRPLLASINTINKCNLHCAGCYWGSTERHEEKQEMLSREEGSQLVDKLWGEGVRQFMFIGGEPLMPPSRDNVEAWTKTVAKRGGFSTIITNGTYGLPGPGELPNTNYFVSMDGGEVGMNKVRGRDHEHGSQPSFTVVAAVLAARAARVGGTQPDVMLAMTISTLNVDTIDEFMINAKKWKVGGVVFSFSTPQLDAKKADGTYRAPYLIGEDRAAAVSKLLEVKDRYGDFVAMSRRSLELFDLEEVAKWYPECPSKLARSIASDGTPIERCIFGPDADCTVCGCSISTSGIALREGDKETAIALTQPQRLAKLAIRR